MKTCTFTAFLPALLAAMLFTGCEQKPKPVDVGLSFLVNGRAGDSVLKPSAEEQTLYLEVYCEEEEWTVSEQGLRADWIFYSAEKAAKPHTWNLSFQLSENTGSFSRTASYLFSSGVWMRKVEITQSVEDPIARTHIIGAYGVEGGDVTLKSNRYQTSRLFYGDNKYSFRMLDPAAVRAVTIGGLPRNLEKGMQFTLQYRVAERGLTLVSTSYEVQVLRIQEPLVWLKKDENTYFVVQL